MASQNKIQVHNLAERTEIYYLNPDFALVEQKPLLWISNFRFLHNFCKIFVKNKLCTETLFQVQVLLLTTCPSPFQWCPTCSYPTYGVLPVHFITLISWRPTCPHSTFGILLVLALLMVSYLFTNLQYLRCTYPRFMIFKKKLSTPYANFVIPVHNHTCGVLPVHNPTIGVLLFHSLLTVSCHNLSYGALPVYNPTCCALPVHNLTCCALPVYNPTCCALPVHNPTCCALTVHNLTYSS